jgi:MFS family permease
MLFLLALVVFVVLAGFWAGIFRRIGWSPWFALLMLIPLSSVVIVLVLAFNKWPIERRVEELEREAAQRR